MYLAGFVLLNAAVSPFKKTQSDTNELQRTSQTDRIRLSSSGHVSLIKD